MGNMPSIIPVTDLRMDAAGVLKRVRSSPDPIFITQRGRPAAVMMSIEAYEKMEIERERLRLLAQGAEETSAEKESDLGSDLARAYTLQKDEES